MLNYRAFELLGVLLGLILAKLIFFLNLGLLAHCGGAGGRGRGKGNKKNWRGLKAGVGVGDGGGKG